MAPLATVSIICLYLATACASEEPVVVVLIEPSYELISWNETEGTSPETLLTNDQMLNINSGDMNSTVFKQAETTYIIRESNLLDFYNTVYTKSNALIVFVDLRREICPIDLFRQRLLGYITMSITGCPTVSDVIGKATFAVDTWTFDLMMFMTQFTASWITYSTVNKVPTSFAVFFDKSGEDHFLLANRKVTQKLMFEIALPLSNCGNSDHVTQLAANTNIKDVIVVAVSTCIYNLMLATSRLHLPATRFRWLIYPTDYIDDFKWDVITHFFDNVSPVFLTERGRSLNRPMYTQPKLFQFANEVTQRFLNAAQNKETNHSCLLNCTSDCTECQKVFRDKFMEIPGQLYEVYAAHSQSDKRKIVFDLNRITSNGNVYLGNWSLDNGITVNQVVYPPSFIDSPLSVVVVVEPPFIFRNISENGNVSYYGYSIDVLKEIAQRSHFSYTVSECDIGGYGLMSNGKWTGCIGHVVRGEADVILGALTTTAERDQVIDFTLPYYNFAGIQILMKKQTANINLFYYANVFTTQAWLSLGAAVVATSILLWAFEKITSPEKRQRHYSMNTPVSSTHSIPLSNQSSGLSSSTIIIRKNSSNDDGLMKINKGGTQNNMNFTSTDIVKDITGMSKNTEQENNDVSPFFGSTYTLAESVWYVIGSLTTTGGGDPPRSFSGRLLIAGFWLLSVIIMSTFTANLAAFLTVSRMGSTITSLDDLARQTEIKYGVVNQSSVMEYFQRMATIEKDFYESWKELSLDRSADGTQGSLAVWDYPLGNKYGTIWLKINETGILKSIDDGIERVMLENFALITESSFIQYYTSKKCDLMAVGEQFSIRPYAIGLKERSPYVNTFSDVILELQKERLLGYLNLRWWANNEVSCPKETGNKGLDLYSLSGTFIVAAAGVTSGFIVLGIEHICRKVTKKKCSNKGDPKCHVLPEK